MKIKALMCKKFVKLQGYFRFKCDFTADIHIFHILYLFTANTKAQK